MEKARKSGALVVIDGSHGEGGPSLVRTALSMAALTQQPVRIEGVRANTPYPGVRPEDLMLARTLAKATSAEITGNEPGSSSLGFLPARLPKGVTGVVEIPEDRDGPGVANAVVILASLAPVLCRSGVYNSISALGETYGPHVLTYDYFTCVTIPAFRALGLYAYADMPWAGFGRGSKGEVRLEIEPSGLHGLKMMDKKPNGPAKAIIAIGEVPDSVGHRGLAQIEKLAKSAQIEVDAQFIRAKTKSPGAYVTFWGQYENGFGGHTGMGARGIRIESVVQGAFDGFLTWHHAPQSIDPFVADQLLVAASMADDESKFSVSCITQRLQTVAWVIKQFVPIHLTILGKEGEPGTVTIHR